jgi:4'-phosphopantetheinyl transferase EntD
VAQSGILPLLALARRLLPPEVKVAAVAVQDVQPALHPDEAEVASDMGSIRRREYAAGRSASRAALDELGMHAAAVGMGRAGAPVWPTGSIGSISHTTDAAIAAVAAASSYASIGVDLEAAAVVGAELEGEILNMCERIWLSREAPQNHPHLRTFLFSAKESVFKCLHPVVGGAWNFQRLTIRPCLRRSAFAAHVTPGAGSCGSEAVVEGRMGWSSGHVLTAAVLPLDHRAHRLAPPCRGGEAGLP